MTDLPNFTVVTFNAGHPTAAIKKGGGWFLVDQTGWAFAEDSHLFDAWPDAVVVALPTVRTQTREQAQKMWAMKLRAMNCDRR